MCFKIVKDEQVIPVHFSCALSIDTICQKICSDNDNLFCDTRFTVFYSQNLRSLIIEQYAPLPFWQCASYGPVGTNISYLFFGSIPVLLAKLDMLRGELIIFTKLKGAAFSHYVMDDALYFTTVVDDEKSLSSRLYINKLKHDSLDLYSDIIQSDLGIPFEGEDFVLKQGIDGNLFLCKLHLLFIQLTTMKTCARVLPISLTEVPTNPNSLKFLPLLIHR